MLYDQSPGLHPLKLAKRFRNPSGLARRGRESEQHNQKDGRGREHCSLDSWLGMLKETFTAESWSFVGDYEAGKAFPWSAYPLSVTLNRLSDHKQSLSAFLMYD